jgi:hypothetical protein
MLFFSLLVFSGTVMALFEEKRFTQRGHEIMQQCQETGKEHGNVTWRIHQTGKR